MSAPTTLNQGIPLNVWQLRDRAGIGVMPLSLLVNSVPNPETEENPTAVRFDPRLREHAELRKQVQRVIKGSGKGRNIPAYADYIGAGLRGDYGDGWATPPVVLWTPQQLTVDALPELPQIKRVMMPFGTRLTAVDAETQVAALHRIYATPSNYGLNDNVGNTQLAFELYWGMPASDARQIFHDRNLNGVEVPKTLALAMDKRDIATQIAEKVVSTVSVYIDGRTANLSQFVNRSKRQLGQKDPEWVTLSGVRSLAVTTMLGRSGIMRTSGVIDPRTDLPRVPSGESVDEDQVVREISEVVKAVFRNFAGEFASRSAITTPAVLAGVGALAHHSMSWASEHIVWNDLLDRLSEVQWERRADLWEGVAAKPTAKGGLSFAGGVKDSAYRVYDALFRPGSTNGRRIRGRSVAAV